jgi:hypothetical protein
LTDETAKENWKKYGNPDGPGGLLYYSINNSVITGEMYYHYTEMGNSNSGVDVFYLELEWSWS